MNEIPDTCTLCGESYTKNAKGERVIFPYPPKHYLCYPCFIKSMNSGINKLNRVLARGNINLSVEEISDIIKPDSNDSKEKREIR